MLLDCCYSKDIFGLAGALDSFSSMHRLIEVSLVWKKKKNKDIVGHMQESVRDAKSNVRSKWM
jgi:hypothetical protein